MNSERAEYESRPESLTTYYVDEAGDGVLFGPKGRNRLDDKDARRYFILGMVQLADEERLKNELQNLRQFFLNHPLYATIQSLRQDQGKTARFFHAKEDHPEVRAKVFELLLSHDFKFYAVIKDMRAVLEYVKQRNEMHADYRYHPNELYDLTVRMLFKNRLHKHDQIHIVFARRGNSDRTKSLRAQLQLARQKFLSEQKLHHEPIVTIRAAYPWDALGLQVADYCLWALQRCYENHEARFLNALWPKVSLVHDVDDPSGADYGRYLTRKSAAPDPSQIKNRRI